MEKFLPKYPVPQEKYPMSEGEVVELDESARVALRATLEDLGVPLKPSEINKE